MAVKFAFRWSASPAVTMAGGSALGLTALTMLAEPDASVGAAILFLGALFFAVLVLAIVHAPGAGRTFAVGALAPAAIVSFVPQLAMLVGAISDPAESLGESLKGVAEHREHIAAGWLLATLAGSACLALRRLWLCERGLEAPRWRRPQFGLRSLFALALIVAVWAANYRVQATRRQAEQDAIHQLSGAGARILSERRGRMPGWAHYVLGPSFHDGGYEVQLPAARLDNETIEALARIPHLMGVTISGPATSEDQVSLLISRLPDCNIERQ